MTGDPTNELDPETAADVVAEAGEVLRLIAALPAEDAAAYRRNYPHTVPLCQRLRTDPPHPTPTGDDAEHVAALLRSLTVLTTGLALSPG